MLVKGYSCYVDIAKMFKSCREITLEYGGDEDENQGT